MANTDSIDRAFSRPFNHVLKLFEDYQLQECAEAAKDLLEEEALPRYHRIKTLVLLASVCADWENREEYRSEAEVLWQESRRCHPETQDQGQADIEQAFREMRVSLDILKAAQKKKRPSYDFEGSDAAKLAEREKHVEEQNALAEAEDEDAIELEEEADRAALAEEFAEKVRIEADSKATESAAPLKLNPSPGVTDDRPVPSAEKSISPHRH